MAKEDVITNFALLEYPFMHEGITHEEYDKDENNPPIIFDKDGNRIKPFIIKD